MTAEIFAAVNLLIGLILVVFGMRAYRVYRGKPWGWLIFAKIILGFYWAGIYAFVLAVEPGDYNPVYFGQVFIRPALTITLAILAAGVIMGSKRQ